MNDKNKFMFISSMSRSGSTLLDKLLCNHFDMSVLSQPFPLLFVEAKKQFYNNINYNEDYYFLNDYFLEEKYKLKDLNIFLHDFLVSRIFLKRIFMKMENYSGQYTKINNIKDIIENIEEDSFIETVKELLFKMKHKKNITYLGIKEVLCEEFVPFLNSNEFKTIIIIRDPRDVMSSIYSGNGIDYVGGNRPLLFNIRNWRKSVSFALNSLNNKNNLYIKFEDLVSNTTKTLKTITSFLNIKPFADNLFEKGIFDQSNKLWKGNSSFGKKENITFTPKKYLKNLPKEVIDYIEFTCYPEMKYLGYAFENNEILESSITEYMEFYTIEREEFSQDYSCSPLNISQEIFRMKLFKEKSKNNKDIIEKYFLFDNVFQELIK